MHTLTLGGIGMSVMTLLLGLLGCFTSNMVVCNLCKKQQDSEPEMYLNVSL